MGHEKLLKYFRIAAPKAGAINQTYYSEYNIRYLVVPLKIEPMPHWCGIFALWAIKTAMVPVGTWVDGGGIGSVSGFKLINKTSAAPGDVGYIHTPFQHHFLIEQVFVQSGVKWVKTIEGNSSPSSNFSFQDRELSKINAVYSCFEPPKVFVAPNDAYAY